MEIFPGHTSFQLLQEIQKTMKEDNIESEQFTDRVIFMPMYNDVVWRNKIKNHYVLRILHLFRIMQKDSLKDIGHFSGQEQKKNGTDRTPTNQTES